MKKDYALARTALESVLNRYYNNRNSDLDVYKIAMAEEGYPSDAVDVVAKGKFFMHKEGPELIHTCGTSQILFRLGHGYVAKTRPDYSVEVEGIHVFDTAIYELELPATIDRLQAIGLSIPEHHYVGVNVMNDRIKVFDDGLSFRKHLHWPEGRVILAGNDSVLRIVDWRTNCSKFFFDC